MEKITDSTVIWRYMSFEKYVSMLISKALYFSSVDEQLDKFEGFFPKNVIISRDQRKLIDTLRRITYINCWHINKAESVAMWKLYSEHNMSVAIKSTYGLVSKAIPNHCHAEAVKYFENDQDLITTHPIDLFARKRACFKHEEELRFIYQNSPLESTGVNSDGKPLFKIKDPNTEASGGMKVDIDLNSVITNVYVSPDSPPWFHGLIKDTNQEFGFDTNVIQSTLYEHPFI